MLTLCQACQVSPAEIVEPRDDPDEPYELCLDCHRRLITFSLRPREWYNLASIHSFYKFCLHDDFYEENGTATQSKKPVIDAELFPRPSLSDVSNSPDELLRYAFTRWQISNELIQSMKTFSSDVWLQTMASWLKQTQNTILIDTIFLLCGKVVGHHAAAFIRNSWEKYRNSALTKHDFSIWYGLCYAVAKCLPCEDGFAFVTEALSQVDDKDVYTHMHVLGWFETPLTLNWIEENIHIFHDQWGHLAALSKMDWQRVKKWLALGRPLSLVALDALKCCVTYNTRMLQEQKPRLVSPPNQQELDAVLLAYLAIDSVPRVGKRVTFLQENWDKLISVHEAG